MKRVILLASLLGTMLLVAPGEARATSVGSGRDFGLGVAVGSVTSLVGKLFLDPYSAIDFGVAFWSYRGRDCWDARERRYYPCRYGWDRVGLNADYLYQENLARGTAKLDWHVGIGGRVWFYGDRYRNDFALAARVPVGLDLTFNRPDRLEVFFEIAPALYVVPGLDLDLEGFIGARFYF